MYEISKGENYNTHSLLLIIFYTKSNNNKFKVNMTVT